MSSIKRDKYYFWIFLQSFFYKCKVGTTPLRFEKALIQFNFQKEAKSGDQECTPEVLAQYKEFIRQQDTRINEVYQANMYLQQELQKSQAEIEEQNQRISNLLDQNQLLKAQTSTTSNAR